MRHSDAPMRRARHTISIVLTGVVLVALPGALIVLADSRSTSSIAESTSQARAVDPMTAERARIAARARRFEARTDEGDRIGRMEVPSMGVFRTAVFAGTEAGALARGPGHFQRTPFPGLGTTVGIAGHRTTYTHPFRHINEVGKGDKVVFDLPYATFTYKVQKVAIVDPDAVEVVRDVGYERLVLISCHPPYSAQYRYIIFARMVREKARGRPA